MTAAFILGVLYHLKEKKLWKFKGCLFLGYILFLLFTSGLRFYLYEIAGLRSDAVRIAVRLLYVTGYSLLIYYLPATINYLLNRPWKRTRLLWILGLRCPILFPELFC